eukprot:6185278-Pleurochrysis_carterae.AAC.2
MKHLDRSAVHAVRARDADKEGAKAIEESSAAAAETATTDYEEKMKQQRAAANVKYQELPSKMQTERDAASDKVAALEGDVTQMQRMCIQANPATARAANKENAAAVSEQRAKE